MPSRPISQAPANSCSLIQVAPVRWWTGLGRVHDGQTLDIRGSKLGLVVRTVPTRWRALSTSER
jgi:hypothetical protein